MAKVVGSQPKTTRVSHAIMLRSILNLKPLLARRREIGVVTSWCDAAIWVSRCLLFLWWWRVSALATPPRLLPETNPHSLLITTSWGTIALTDLVLTHTAALLVVQFSALRLVLCLQKEDWTVHQSQAIAALAKASREPTRNLYRVWRSATKVPSCKGLQMLTSQAYRGRARPWTCIQPTRPRRSVQQVGRRLPEQISKHVRMICAARLCVRHRGLSPQGSRHSRTLFQVLPGSRTMFKTSSQSVCAFSNKSGASLSGPWSTISAGQKQQTWESHAEKAERGVATLAFLRNSRALTSPRFTTTTTVERLTRHYRQCSQETILLRKLVKWPV